MPVLPKKGISLFAAIALLAMVVAIIPGIIGEDVKAWCAQTLGPNYKYWLLGMFVIGAAVLVYLTTDFGKVEKNTEQTPLTPSELETYRTGIREWLKKRYELRRSQKMAGNLLPINLNFYSTLKGVREGDRSSFIEVNVEGSDEQILQIFHLTKGRLLLLGEPGAGKTMQLIELGLNLLEGEPDSMPAILNLATWASDFPTLQEWLKKVLPYEIGANATLAMKALTQSRVILLLDGFDEITPEHRVSFFEKLALYKLEHPHCEFVISTRIDEYLEAASQKAPPIEYQPVEVASLSLDQIRKKLKILEISGEQYAHRFHAALDDNSLICKAATIPLYFNCLQTLFTLKPLSEWNFTTKTQEDCDAEILNRFILFELEKCKKQTTQYWLSFLASRMEERDMVRFELKDLQYAWWRWKILILPVLLDALVAGFLGALVYIGMVAGIPIGIISKSIIIGLILPFMVLCFIAIIGLVAGILGMTPATIETRDELHWTRFEVDSILFIGIITGIAFGLFCTKIDIHFFKGFVLGIIMGMGPGLFDFLKREHTSFLKISSPYQRFISSMKSLHFSIIQHLLLRYKLYRKDLLPLRLVDFLNEMASYQSEKEKQQGKPKPRRFTTADVHLLESDGATWRFRHRLIQEWFAKKWKKV